MNFRTNLILRYITAAAAAAVASSKKFQRSQQRICLFHECLEQQTLNVQNVQVQK
jgi:hypothetical protein